LIRIFPKQQRQRIATVNLARQRQVCQQGHCFAGIELHELAVFLQARRAEQVESELFQALSFYCKTSRFAP
jgi:hypothetical protein